MHALESVTIAQYLGSWDSQLGWDFKYGGNHQISKIMCIDSFGDYIDTDLLYIENCLCALNKNHYDTHTVSWENSFQVIYTIMENQ